MLPKAMIDTNIKNKFIFLSFLLVLLLLIYTPCSAAESDQFSNSSLHPRWNWYIPPPSYDLTSQSGWLYMDSEAYSDFWQNNFSGAFLYQEASGDFTVETRIQCDPNDAYHQAGLAVKSNSGTSNWTTLMTEQGSELIVTSKRTSGGSTSSQNDIIGSAANLYLKITRSGSLFSFQYSTNGTDWIPLGSQTSLSLTDPVYVGLGIAAANTSTSFDCYFDYFDFDDTPPPPPPPSEDEHVWLHVEGRYIKTSPCADPPNEIFVGVGMCYREHTYNGTYQGILDWAKLRNVNSIRLSIYAYSDYNFNDPNSIINNDIDPWIQMSKSNKVYTYLDCHEYFHQFEPYDGWWPTGPLWTDATFRDWIDYWVAVAAFYKNEPWVLAYELVNEASNVDADVSRYWHTECVKAIRQVDARHIIILGNNNLAHTTNIEEVWGPVHLRPDEPYNQIVFSFHEYPMAQNPDITQPIIDYIQNRFDVPLFCTEFGAMAVIGGVTEAMMRQFETDMFAMMGPRKIGWSIYVLNGTCPDDGRLPHEDIWVPAAADQGSDIPVPGVVPQASKIVCGAYPEYAYYHGGILNYIVADGTSITTVKATICDGYGIRVSTATDLVSFSISGEGRWEEDGTTGVKPVNARDGIATIDVRSTSTPGTITVNASDASAGILIPGSVQITTFGLPNKLSCNAKPDSLPADGASLSHIAARIEDSLGNAVPIAQNTVTFSLEGTGSLWMTEEIEGNRGVMEDGIGNIFVKAGIIDEVIKVTASADGLISGSVKVYVGNVEKPPDPNGEEDDDDNPFNSVKVYPNPFILDGGSNKMTFTSLPEESTLRIYTLSGKLVCTLKEDGGGEITWDGKNSEGNDIITGIYVYLLTDQEGTRKIYRGNMKTGKLLVR